MKFTNILKPLALSVLLAPAFTSCKEWLEVEMEDKIMEPVLFSDYKGYMAALNGVYLSLNDLYAAKTTLIDLTDVMAQQYDVTENISHSYVTYMNHKFGDAGFESKNTALWNRTYSIIANDNILLDHLEAQGDTPLNDQQFKLVRAEALALRALLHFDLVRRHGAIYSQDPDGLCVPFQPDSRREVQPFLSQRDVMARIIADLNEAASLLQASDPIITEGVKNEVTEDNGVSMYDLSFRQLRLNYYAVKALLARAYMWTGDNAAAYDIVTNDIIAAQKGAKLTVFPWTSRNQFEADKRPDYICSSEIMFSLYLDNRVGYNNNLFSQSLNNNNRLYYYGETMADSKVALVFDHENDLRRKWWDLVEPTQAEIDKAAEEGRDPKSTLYFKKFIDWESGYSINGPDTYRYMMPMIRLSEVYLMAAELAPTDQEAYDYLNELRTQRQCPVLEPAGRDRQLDVMYEFIRETIGEGQLYYFYKRKAATLVVGRTGEYDCEMSLGAYVWPIPEAELEKRK